MTPGSGRPSRRDLLAGIAVGVAGLAGCAVPFSGGTDRREDVSLPADAVGSVAWPASPFPVSVPPALADAHRERARDALDDVPADPSIPNRAVAAEIRSDRERAADRIERAVDEPWPTEALSEWRSRRGEAATVLGAYRAATGRDDAATLEERTATIRSDLGSFTASHEYRASSPLEAVLVHAPIEELTADCRRRVRPTPAYPADPLDRPFRAGDAVGRVEAARATLADAEGLRAAYLADRPDPAPQWAALIDAMERLGFAVARTRSTVREFLDVEEPPFRADLDGTVGYWLFTTASGQVEAAIEDHEERRDDGEHATAAIEAGKALASVEALRATVEGIRAGAYQEAATVESVTRTAERAREAVTAIEGSADPQLAARIGRPAFGAFEYIPDQIEEGYLDATRAQGELAWVELYARAVPAAAAFVLDRLE